MIRFLILTILTATALFSVQVQAQVQTKAQVPFGDGESLSYTVSYRAALIPNINVMNVTLRTLSEEVGGRSNFHIVGNGKTSKFVKGFFNLNDTYHSWLDSETLMPTRMTSDIKEDSYRFKATYNYDWNAMSVNVVTRNAKWNADRFNSMPLKDNSGDAFSLVYKLRGIDETNLEIGKPYPLDLILNNATRTIYYTYLGVEEIKVRKIGTFRAHKIKCTIATDDGTTYEEGMELTAWFSDDKNRVPLYIESPIRVGRVRVTLTEWTVIHPFTAKIK